MNKEFIEDAIKKAEQGMSKLTNDILALEGMSGKAERHLFNIIGSLDNINFLEIGCFNL